MNKTWKHHKLSDPTVPPHDVTVTCRRITSGYRIRIYHQLFVCCSVLDPSSPVLDQQVSVTPLRVTPDCVQSVQLYL